MSEACPKCGTPGARYITHICPPPRVPSGGGEGQHEQDLGERIRARADQIRKVIVAQYASKRDSDIAWDALEELVSELEAKPVEGEATLFVHTATARVIEGIARKLDCNVPAALDLIIEEFVEHYPPTASTTPPEVPDAKLPVETLRQIREAQAINAQPHERQWFDRYREQDRVIAELQDALEAASTTSAERSPEPSSSLASATTKAGQADEEAEFIKHAVESFAGVVRAEEGLGGDQGSPSAEVFIDARCDCDRCTSRTEDVYRMVGSCSNCKAEGLLILYRAGDKIADQDCPVCEDQYSVRTYSQRLASPDEIPASTTRPEAVPSSPPAKSEVCPGTGLAGGGSLPDTARRLDFALAVIDDHDEEHPDARLRADYEQRVEEEETETRGQAMEP